MPNGSPIQRAGDNLVDPTWKRRTFYGVHPQKQEGLNYIGLHVPVGRLQAPEMLELARIADEYGNGEIRITVEQNLILPNVPTAKVEKLMTEPLLQIYSPNPTPLLSTLVACTGSQFCGQAIAETKARSLQLTQELDATMEVPRPIRLHFTGCPNTCAQVQVSCISVFPDETLTQHHFWSGVCCFACTSNSMTRNRLLFIQVKHYLRACTTSVEEIVDFVIQKWFRIQGIAPF